MLHDRHFRFVGLMPRHAVKASRLCAAIAKNGTRKKGIWSDRPRHDNASHGADAFQTLSVWWRELREEEPPEDLETRMRRQHAEHAKAMDGILKPKPWTSCGRNTIYRWPRIEQRTLTNECLRDFLPTQLGLGGEAQLLHEAPASSLGLLLHAVSSNSRESQRQPSRTTQWQR